MLILYTIISIVIISFGEWWVHRFIMHKKWSWLYQIWYNHAKLHHFKYFKEFNHEPDEAGKQLNIKLDLLETLCYILPLLIVGIIFFPSFTITLIIVLTIHHLIWNIIHQEMHVPKRWWIRNFPGFRYLEKYHWLHHKYTGKNFNVVFPGFDWLMGTYIGPTEKDEIQMKRELEL